MQMGKSSIVLILLFLFVYFSVEFNCFFVRWSVGQLVDCCEIQFFCQLNTKMTNTCTQHRLEPHDSHTQTRFSCETPKSDIYYSMISASTYVCSPRQKRQKRQNESNKKTETIKIRSYNLLGLFFDYIFGVPMCASTEHSCIL